MDGADDDGTASRVAGMAIGALAGLAFGLIAAALVGVLRPELAAGRTIVAAATGGLAAVGLVAPRAAHAFGVAGFTVVLGLFDGGLGNGELRAGGTTGLATRLLFGAASAAGLAVATWWFWLR